MRSPPNRVLAATDKASAIVTQMAADDGDIDSARQTFMKNATAGKDAVQSGRADCGTVEASLTRLEQIEQE
ncbi:MAG TPA: hypothetical protein VFA50_02680 [Stellaceae bacterium]|nr:hypothetical protein [Stellaceae bacterium]